MTAKQVFQSRKFFITKDIFVGPLFNEIKNDMIFYILKEKTDFNLTYQSSVVIYRVKSITGFYMT